MASHPAALLSSASVKVTGIPAISPQSGGWRKQEFGGTCSATLREGELKQVKQLRLPRKGVLHLPIAANSAARLASSWRDRVTPPEDSRQACVVSAGLSGVHGSVKHQGRVEVAGGFSTPENSPVAARHAFGKPWRRPYSARAALCSDTVLPPREDLSTALDQA